MKHIKENKKNLMLITDEFPYNHGESFLIAEMPHLTKFFNVTIVSGSLTDSLNKKIPKDIPIHKINLKMNPPLRDKLKYSFKFLLSKTCLKELFNIFKEKRLIKTRIAYSVGTFAIGMKWYESLVKVPNFENQDVLYFYWYNAKLVGTALSIKKQKNRPKIITRLHGYDLFNERITKGYRQPFKPLIDRYIDKLFFASEAGFNYYKKTYGFKEEDKYSIARLGTLNDFGIGQPHDNTQFSLVSCSNVIPIKRVELIVNALSLIEESHISWTHFGSGNSFDEMLNLAKQKLGDKKNITYNFTGVVENRKIHEHYKKYNVDCFITTSSTEGGCPVSIQEAMSFGIPIIGTRVGGIPEMIDNNGILLSKNPTATQVARAIKNMIGSKSDGSIESMRKESHRIWKESFNADTNFYKFVKEIGSL